MKAAVVSRRGGPEVIEVRADLPEPVVKDVAKDVLVEVEAVGVNFADTLQTQGMYPNSPRPPYVPGLEFAGRIAGTQDRVMGFTEQGACAERVAVRKDTLLPIPKDWSAAEAAAFPVNYYTAYFAYWMAGLLDNASGKKVLIHAVAGGVGTASVEVGKLLGVEMFGTASTAEKLEKVRALGLHHGINYKEKDFEEEIGRLTGGAGVDAVFEMLGGEDTARSTRCLAEMGTLIVYGGLLAYRREQLGLTVDRPLLRQMNRFGLPLVPSMLALWLLNFGDRIFLLKLSDVREVGLYSIGSRIASAMVLLLTAFRAAWPAFAYSIEDDEEAKRSYAYVLTYLLYVASWAALALGLLAPWLVRLLTTPTYYEASRVVAPLAFGGVAFGGFIVVSIALGRTKRTQFNWVVTGGAAAVSVTLNVLLIPTYGMMGAAAANVTAFTVMFLGITWWSQRVFPVPYQWRRVVTVVGTAVALTILGKALALPLAVAIALVAAYPICLWPLRFYLPAELRWIKRRSARTAP